MFYEYLLNQPRHSARDAKLHLHLSCEGLGVVRKETAVAVASMTAEINVMSFSRFMDGANTTNTSETQCTTELQTQQD